VVRVEARDAVQPLLDDVPGRLPLHGAQDLVATADEQVHLGTVVRPPVVQLGVEPLVVDRGGDLGDDELLEAPAAGLGVEGWPEAMGEGVGDPRVEEVIARVGDEALGWALRSGRQFHGEEGVFQDLVVLLCRLHGHRALARCC